MSMRLGPCCIELESGAQRGVPRVLQDMLSALSSSLHSESLLFFRFQDSPFSQKLKPCPHPTLLGTKCPFHLVAFRAPSLCLLFLSPEQAGPVESDVRTPESPTPCVVPTTSLGSVSLSMKGGGWGQSLGAGHPTVLAPSL